MKKYTSLREAIHSKKTIGGLTHDFYRYPARFSPQFVRAIIECFTSPGETVLDPFMGSGTTLVEARSLGRNGVGIDVSSLAVFIAKVKTTPLSVNDIRSLRNWAFSLGNTLNLRNPRSVQFDSHDLHYQRNIVGKPTWPIREIIHRVLGAIADLPLARQRAFARCVLLRASQWALDCREEVPEAGELRAKFYEFLEQMLIGTQELSAEMNVSEKPAFGKPFTMCLHRSAVGLHTEPSLRDCEAPTLVITSPPYPGVHVLYHRWQVLGRKETPAPFWIAGCRDGDGASFYTMGDRNRPKLVPYFKQLLESFRSLSKLCTRKTFVVQMLGFSEPSWQLPEYLRVMSLAGFSEQKCDDLRNAVDGRTWRKVPNRRWYADHGGHTAASAEVVICHKLS